MMTLRFESCTCTITCAVFSQSSAPVICHFRIRLLQKLDSAVVLASDTGYQYTEHDLLRMKEIDRYRFI